MPTEMAAAARRPTHLATFCNNGRAAFALIDAEGIVEVREISIGSPAKGVVGTVGAAFGGGRFYVAIQADPPVVAVFERDWTQVGLIEPREVKDIHGLAVHAGDLLIVSTGTNQIVACDLATGAERPFWSDSLVLSDSVHVNDVAAADGRVVASRFGPRNAAGQRSGEVFDVLTGETLVAHLREPHSATLSDGALHVLESPTGDLLRCSPGFSPHRLYGIVGYARGLAVSPTTIAIGKSGYRQKSRQGIGDARLAPLNATEASAEALSLSGVFIVERATGDWRFIDTTSIGIEVYAVLSIPADTVVGKAPQRRQARPAAAGVPAGSASPARSRRPAKRG